MRGRQTMADREEVMRLIDAKPDWDGLKVGLRAMVAGEMRVGVPDVVRAVSEEAGSQIREDLEAHLEEVEARMHATVRRAAGGLQAQLERQATEHRREMEEMQLALEAAQRQAGEQGRHDPDDALPPGNPPDDDKQVGGTEPAMGDRGPERLDADSLAPGADEVSPQRDSPKGKRQQEALPEEERLDGLDTATAPALAPGEQANDGGGSRESPPPSSPTASRVSTATHRTRPSAASARPRPESRRSVVSGPARPPPPSAAAVEKALSRMQQLDHRISKLEVATLGDGSIGPPLESDDEEGDEVKVSRSRPASRAASRRSRLSHGAMTSRCGRKDEAEAESALQPTWGLDSSMTASGAFQYLADGMKVLQRATAEVTGKVREMEAEMSRRSESIGARISAAVREALSTGISDARNHVAEAVKSAETELERERERQSEVMEAKLEAVRSEMEYRVGDLSRHVDNLNQRTDSVVQRAVEAQGDELVAGMRKQTARLASTVDYHVQLFGERLAGVEKRAMEEITQLAQHVAKAEADAQNAAAEAAAASERAAHCEQTLGQLRDELRAVTGSGEGVNNAMDTMREAFRRYDEDLAEVKRSTKELQDGKAEADAVERLQAKVRLAAAHC